jgi:hypothetical protein
MQQQFNAMQRLIARSALDHTRNVEKLYDTLKSRHVPATLNKTDYTIGFKMDMESVLRALDLIGFRKHGSHGNGYMLSDGHTEVRLFEPREDWHPVLQVI